MIICLAKRILSDKIWKKKWQKWVFLDDAETTIGFLLCFVLFTVFSQSIFCITSLGDCIRPQHQETIQQVKK